MKDIIESFPAKISRPKLREIYPRKRVFDIMTKSRKYSAMWICGPAGSGKTTAVNSYISDQNMPCLWYNIGEEDSDISNFFFFMRIAVSAFCTSDANLPPEFTKEHSKSLPLFTKLFFEQLFSLLPLPSIIVLDDYQDLSKQKDLSKEPILHNVVSDAISQVRNQIGFYILSRLEPPSNMSELIGKRDLYVMGWEHLRLELEETHGIVEHVSRMKIPRETIDNMHEKTSGWVIGLILLLQNNKFDKIEPQYIDKHPPQVLFDYIQDKLFDKLHDHQKKFMLNLAFLPIISELTARTITGRDNAKDLLAEIYRKNLFLNKLVGKEILYQFHPLMQEFLRARAIDDKNLLKKSAEILFEDEYFEESIRLYVKADEELNAVSLVLSKAPELASQGRFQTIENMIDRLPVSITEKNPWFLYWRAVCHSLNVVKKKEDLLSNDNILEMFKKALSFFEKKSDRDGSYLALAGILDCIWFDMNCFYPLDAWIDKYNELYNRFGPTNCPEVMQQLTPSMFGALVMRQPDHPDMSKWLEECKKWLTPPTDPPLP